MPQNNTQSIQTAEKLKLKPGDHLIAQRILYTHHGLYIDEGYVAEYSLDYGVHLILLDEFIADSKLRLRSHANAQYSPKEAVERGLDVTAVVRGENQSVATKVIQKDLYDLTKDDLKDFDVVVDAFGAWAEEDLPQHSTSLKHLCDILSGTDIRLCIVGGAGSLYVNPEHTLCVADGTDFPDIFKPLASAMAKALKELRERKDVKWTYVSPAG